ncbi:hypothetical protein EAF00_010543 [Botryotinia globosa]|nr:hypothetical protein EAF00_010543 [Botryotinia globosa]
MSAHDNRRKEKSNVGPGDSKEAPSFDPKYPLPLHLVAWRLRLSLADIGLRILPIIFLGKGGRRDSEEWLRYLLVTGKARSRKGLGLKYHLEYLDGFSIFFLLFQEIQRK